MLNWGNFAQIERNSPEIFGAKLDCAGSPISGEKNNYCVQNEQNRLYCVAPRVTITSQQLLKVSCGLNFSYFSKILFFIF
jgi:hypothetical protein